MIRHLESVAARTWSPSPEEVRRWELAAATRLGDLDIFHHPSLARLATELDPGAGRLHRLEWDPGDGPALPLLLLESRHRLGPLALPVLTVPTHRFYLYSSAYPTPGLLDAVAGMGPRAPGLPDRLRFLPHLPGHGPDGPTGDSGSGTESARTGSVRTYPEVVCPGVRVAAAWGNDWQRYWDARAHGLRREVPRFERRMQETASLEYHFSGRLDPPALSALEEAMRLHRARWAARGHADSDLRSEERRVGKECRL